MKVSCPSAYFATLGLAVYLALQMTAAVSAAAGAGEAESVRLKAYRANLLTPYEERIVGQRLAYLYEQRHTLSNDADARARLDRIEARLGAVIRGQALDIKVVRGAQPEAVSFPSGHIYVTSALVKLAAADDEFAAVIAHEAAHIAGHHLSRLIALALVTQTSDTAQFPNRRAIITGQSLQFAFPSTLDGARLRCEMEADQVAVRWLVSAGYEDKALAMVLSRLTTQLSQQGATERAALQARISLLREQSALAAEVKPFRFRAGE
jgi:predicted Zn-dependent protease